jgi:hypothetical protein
MAKKDESKSTPVVSKIPLPVSQTPLVIDLPDGQKLVIGEMTPGAVIEVATWRGTGRPDSRTSRLMLGMSSGQSELTEESVKPVKPVKNGTEISIGKQKIRLPKIKFDINLPKVSQIFGKFTESAKATMAKSKELAPVESTSELNINQWIERISQEAAANVAKSRPKDVRTGTRKNV